MFKVGDRIKFPNAGTDSIGTINNVVDGEYKITWDDGFIDDEDVTYLESEIQRMEN